jgi:hypothetical protein
MSVYEVIKTTCEYKNYTKIYANMKPIESTITNMSDFMQIINTVEKLNTDRLKAYNMLQTIAEKKCKTLIPNDTNWHFENANHLRRINIINEAIKKAKTHNESGWVLAEFMESDKREAEIKRLRGLIKGRWGGKW